MARTELTAAYEAACKAHGDFYMETYRPAAAAHLKGEMSTDDYLAIRAKNEELLADIDPLYNLLADLPEEGETETCDGEQADLFA